MMTKSKKSKAAVKKVIALNKRKSKSTIMSSSLSSNDNSFSAAIKDKDFYNGNTPGTEFVLPDMPVPQKSKGKSNTIAELCCCCNKSIAYTDSQQHVCGNTGNIIHGWCTAPELIEKYGHALKRNWCISCYEPWSGKVVTSTPKGNNLAYVT
jgi:hypothetical protein